MVKSTTTTRKIMKHDGSGRDDEEKQSSLTTLQETISETRARRYAWAISYLYPDIYSPVRVPDRYRLPTHIMTNKRQETITIGPSHDFAIYFSPLVDCFYNYKFNNAGEIYAGMTNSWTADSYISYAHNNGQPTSGTTAGVDYVFDSLSKFNILSKWNTHLTGSTNLQHFRKVRLLGAALKITYTGKAEERSGIVKVAMGIKGFTSTLLSESITADELVNFPEYKVFDLEKPIVCRYRLSDNDFTEFGPYTPYSTLPYYIIYGKGLQEGSTIFVETIKHFEGVVVSSQDEFVSPTRASSRQANVEEQLNYIEKIKNRGAVEQYSEVEHQALREMLD